MASQLFLLLFPVSLPGPNAISPYFEARFARLEYLADDNYNLSYMRHTGQWWEIDRDLSLEECFGSREGRTSLPALR